MFLLVSGRHVGAHRTNMASSYKKIHRISCLGKIADLHLSESVPIFTFFLFSDSGTYLLNGFAFYFDLF